MTSRINSVVSELKQWIFAVTIATAFGLVTWSAEAQEPFPAQPMTMIVPFSAGGPTDIFGRIIAEELSEVLGQTVVVQNQPGAAGMIGSEAVAQSKPDGYTMLFGTAATHGINVSLYEDLPYHPLDDFEIVSFIGGTPFALLASPSVPGQLKELIADAKENPDKYTYASAGNGSTSHLLAEMLKNRADIEILHIPYEGSAPAMQDIVAGRVDLMFESLGFAKSFIEAGKLQAIALGAQKRSPLHSEVPTFDEAGLPGFEAGTWNILAVPAGTPDAIVNQLNTAVNKVLADPEMQQRLLELSFIPAESSTPESATDFVSKEIDKFAEAVAVSGAKAK